MCVLTALSWVTDVVCVIISCCRLVLYTSILCGSLCSFNWHITTRRFKSADLVNFLIPYHVLGTGSLFIHLTRRHNNIKIYIWFRVCHISRVQRVSFTSRPYIQILKIQLRNPLSIIEFKLPKKSSFVIFFFFFLTFKNLICFSLSSVRVRNADF